MKNTPKVSNRYIRHMYRLAREIIEFYADGQNWESHTVEMGMKDAFGAEVTHTASPKIDGGLRARAFLRMETLATVKLKYQATGPYDASGRLPSVTKALSAVAAREARAGLPKVRKGNILQSGLSSGNTVPIRTAEQLANFAARVSMIESGIDPITGAALAVPEGNTPFDPSTVKQPTTGELDRVHAERMAAEAAARPHGLSPKQVDDSNLTGIV